MERMEGHGRGTGSGCGDHRWRSGSNHLVNKGYFSNIRCPKFKTCLHKNPEAWSIMYKLHTVNTVLTALIEEVLARKLGVKFGICQLLSTWKVTTFSESRLICRTTFQGCRSCSFSYTVTSELG